MVGLVIYERLGGTNKTDSCEDRDNTGKKMQRAAEMTILTRMRLPEWLPPLITRTGGLPCLVVSREFSFSGYPENLTFWKEI